MTVVQIEKAKEVFLELNEWQRQQFLIDLLESGTIKFEELSTQYVKKLQRERWEKDTANATLGLLLSGYCINDQSSGGKNARKHLYETGHYTGKDGSIFGQQLEVEFGNNNNEL